METLLSVESIDLNQNENIVNTNKYKIQYYNMITLLKVFFYLFFEPKTIDNVWRNKIIEYFLKFRNILKKNNLIFSNYLIPLYNGEEKVEKTILEICFLITISFLSTEKDDVKINTFFDFFENKDRSCKEYGESLFSLFDKLNKNNENINDIVNIKINHRKILIKAKELVGINRGINIIKQLLIGNNSRNNSYTEIHFGPKQIIIIANIKNNNYIYFGILISFILILFSFYIIKRNQL